MNKKMPLFKPYKGLMPYTEEDAPFFFGREKEREIVIANLMASRLTLFYGPSGVGKSSVLRAGVAFQLRQQAQHNLNKFGSPRFIIVEFSSWRDDPIRGMLGAVQTAISKTFEGKTIKPARSNRLAQILKARTEDVNADLFIVLDQFEEYFLYHEHEDGKGTFAVEFPDAVTLPDLRVNFLVSLRDDALAKLDRFKGRIPNLFDNYLRIEHLDQEAARAAIERPIEEFNRHLERQKDRVIIEPELVKVVIEQVKMGQVLFGEAGRGQIAQKEQEDLRVETPYLQLVMTRLWDEEMRAKSRVLRLKTLSHLGWASRIVRTHLDEVMRTLRPEVQQLAALIFNYLVTPSGTKIAYTVSDLASYAKISEPQIKTVLDVLASGPIRILRPIPALPNQPNVPRYEIFHDVLTTSILEWRAQFLREQDNAERKQQDVTRNQEEGVTKAKAMKVFISYSQSDEQVAKRITNVLSRLGISFFLDVKDIHWGDRTTQKIQNGLEGASHAVVIVSPASLKSQWVLFEIGFALGRELRILPFLTHRGLDLPPFMKDLHFETNVEKVEKYFNEELSKMPR